MGIADLGTLDQLYAAYLISQFLVILVFAGWFVARLDRIRSSNGSLDLYWNFLCRLLPIQFLLYLLWLYADYILRVIFAH